jgi:signal peptidase I
MTTGDTPLVAEEGTPPIAENDTPAVAESTPPVAEDETPPVSEVCTPPVPEVVTPSVAHGGTPAATESTLPAAEDRTLPASEGGTLLAAEDGAPTSEGDMPPVADGTPSVVEDDTPPLVADETPAVSEIGTLPVTEGGVPPVAAGDISWVADKGTSKASASQGSKLATWARRLRMLVAYVLLLTVLVAAGICAFALVQGTWMVTPILSGSMRPGLAVGGVAVSQRVRVDSLAVRDVIVFADPYKPSEQIVHRIVRITKNSPGQLLFNTQGDANTVRDPWTMTIRGNDVYRVRWTVPLVGYIAIAYQNHRGFFLLGAGIVLILIAVSTVFGTSEGRRRRHARRASPASR